MADMKSLSEEMEKLKKQIETILCMSGYRECEELSTLDDFKRVKTADDRQKLETYRRILYKLDAIQRDLAYFERPVQEVSPIYANADGRYETKKGYYYTCGSGIEFLRTEEVYNGDKEDWENVEIWTTSRVEGKNGRYYIVDYPNLEMSGLIVRVRE